MINGLDMDWYAPKGPYLLLRQGIKVDVDGKWKYLGPHGDALRARTATAAVMPPERVYDLSSRSFILYILSACACGSVTVKSTGIWVHGEVKIWTEDHFHFLVSLLVLKLVIRRVYDLAVEV